MEPSITFKILGPPVLLLSWRHMYYHLYLCSPKNTFYPIFYFWKIGATSVHCSYLYGSEIEAVLHFIIYCHPFIGQFQQSLLHILIISIERELNDHLLKTNIYYYTSTSLCLFITRAMTTDSIAFSTQLIEYSCVKKYKC